LDLREIVGVFALKLFSYFLDWSLMHGALSVLYLYHGESRREGTPDTPLYPFDGDRAARVGQAGMVHLSFDFPLKLCIWGEY
jgi:hypothetical protein